MNIAGLFSDTASTLPPGEHVMTEYLFRVTTPDGRIRDHGPSKFPRPGTLRCPRGSTVQRLSRTVTAIVTEWQPDPEDSGGTEPATRASATEPADDAVPGVPDTAEHQRGVQPDGR